MSDNGVAVIPDRLAPIRFAERTSSYTPIGDTGLFRFGGYLIDDPTDRLTGQRWFRTVRAMQRTATIKGMLLAVELPIRRAEWTMAPAEGDDVDPAEAQQVADFVDSCRQDMRNTWEDILAEIISFLVYGFDLHEIVLKRRLGDRGKQPSAYDDGKVGWDDWSPRPADTVVRWEFDQYGHVTDFVQQAPSQTTEKRIPLSRCLHFKNGSYRGSPQGESVLRSAYRDWDYIEKLELLEGMRVQRDAVGLPVGWMPPEYMSADALPKQSAVFERVKQVVQGIGSPNDQSGVVMPLVYDDKGNPLFKLELMASGGATTIDAGAVIIRHTVQMTRAILEDFLTLGQSAVGSFALSKSKTDLFLMAIAAWLDLIANVINDQAIKPLIRINAIDPKLTPTLRPGAPDEADLIGLGRYFTSLWPAVQTLEREDQLDILDYFLDVADLPQIRASREALAKEPEADETPESPPEDETVNDATPADEAATTPAEAVA